MRRFRGTPVFAALLLAGVVLSGHPRPSHAACVGDCDGSGDVTVNELITMVNIALGAAPLSNCAVGDADGSGDITINEIIAAVNNALGVCPPLPATPTPTGTPTATVPVSTATPTLTPTWGLLGVRHFVLNPTPSQFSLVFAPGSPIALGGFRGQKNGQVDLPAYLDLQAGQPDAHGVATIDVIDASDYLYVDTTLAGVVCIKPLVPVSSAGLVTCDGGLDFSIGLTQNHHLGQIGTGGFTVDQCTSQGGSVESPNQICAAGLIGALCRAHTDCDSSPGASDGICGLSPSACSAPDGAQGAACQADADCDTSLGANDGRCGLAAPHPGVCNGTYEVSQLGGDSGPGAVSISLIPELGLKGLPAELNIESALPCGDEGPGALAPFTFTTATFQTTILNAGNNTGTCSAGKTASSCATNSDCDATPGAGNGICGATLAYESQGQNFSCADWQASDGPGCLVFSAPQLDTDPSPSGGDAIIAFAFCSQ